MSRLETWLKCIKDKESPNYKIKKALENMNKAGYSMRDIAKLCEIPLTSLHRMFKNVGASVKDRAEILQEKFRDGKLEPTIREFTEEDKVKISEQIAQRWKDRPDITAKIKDVNRQKWESMSESEKDERTKKMQVGIRKAAEFGSKLEFIVADIISKAGFVSVKHRTGVLSSQDLEFDLYISEIATIIEVDGPSHFLPIWGEDRLQKNKERDIEKAGAATSKGFNFIRIINKRKNITKKYIRELTGRLQEVLFKIQKEKHTAYYTEIV